MALKSSNSRGRRLKRIVRVLLGLILLAVVLWFLLADMWRISDVQIVGVKHSDQSAIHAKAWDVLDTKRLFVLPGNQMFLFARGKIEKQILESFAGVETVDLDVDHNGLLTVTVSDRRALGVWCDAAECYFYDDGGVVFKKSFAYTGALFTAWKYGASDALVKLGDTVPCPAICLDEDFLGFLHGHRIDRAEIDKELVVLRSIDGYYIKAGFDATTTMRHVGQMEKVSPGLLKDVEYVDARFPHKIFYRVRGE